MVCQVLHYTTETKRTRQRFVVEFLVLSVNGLPEQIAQDLTRVQNLKVDEVFFSDQASPTVDEAVRRLEEIQTAVRR